MIHLDLIMFLYQLFLRFWEALRENVGLIKTVNSFLIAKLDFPLQLTKDVITVGIETLIPEFLIRNTPPTFFSCIKLVLSAFRNVCNVRLCIGWFPNINPWNWPWPILTEPVDMVFRPLSWRFPKFYHLDFSTWAIFYTLDSTIRYCQYLSEMSDRYYGLI